MQTRRAQCLIRRGSASAWLLLTSPVLIAQGTTTPSTLAPASTPAHQIFDLSVFVVAITGGIFLVVGGLLAVALYRFRARKTDPLGEPAQIYGSTQIELAWTVIPSPDRGRSLPCDGTHHLRDSRRAKAKDGSRCHSNRTSVLVGVSIPEIWRGHRKRTPHSSQFQRCAVQRPSSS